MTAPADQDSPQLRGMRLLSEIAGTERPAILDALAPIAPDLGRYIVEFAYGEVYHRPGLSLATRQLVTVAVLAALGTAGPQFGFHVNGALNVGCDPHDILASVLESAAPAGDAAVISGLTVTLDVFDARGITSVSAAAGAPVVALAGAPELGRRLADLGFGGRDLEARTRALIGIAAHGVHGPATAQGRAQVRELLASGGQAQEAVEAAMQIAVYAGFPAAINTITVIGQTLAASAAEPRA
ncbi:carboxymuconolactone decarboxylase family protein [Actinoplanes sp. L3-i22]|uniref:carboxymuconolactone decarboxylase family protein n=1 Tax=Actinoplanes sp. L3-i22 TaxID=2836373 RepID=UPI001C754210|nr:carboxymuconolactone decarboxylase family protein [Actinoplanes sp. L3-i22]BCY08852.1 hypothetical protein L3i22_039400 [Actinoplanes sp. L3-i22]